MTLFITNPLMITILALMSDGTEKKKRKKVLFAGYELEIVVLTFFLLTHLRV